MGSMNFFVNLDICRKQMNRVLCKSPDLIFRITYTTIQERFLFSGEICTQQAANILIAVKYIWCNMLGEMQSLNQLSMNTHAHGQNASLHTDTLTAVFQSQRQNLIREKRLPLLDVNSTWVQPWFNLIGKGPDKLFPTSYIPVCPLLSEFNCSQDAILFSIYNTYCATVTRICNLKQKTVDLCNRSKAH